MKKGILKNKGQNLVFVLMNWDWIQGGVGLGVAGVILAGMGQLSLLGGLGRGGIAMARG